MNQLTFYTNKQIRLRQLVFKNSHWRWPIWNSFPVCVVLARTYLTKVDTFHPKCVNLSSNKNRISKSIIVSVVSNLLETNKECGCLTNCLPSIQTNVQLCAVLRVKVACWNFFSLSRCTTIVCACSVHILFGAYPCLIPSQTSDRNLQNNRSSKLAENECFKKCGKMV